MKTYTRNLLGLMLITGLFIAFSGCEKFLDEKSNSSLVIPSKLKDLQALLDYDPFMNSADLGATEVSADNYYLKDADYQALSTNELRNMYTWKGANVFSLTSNDWSLVYRAVNYTNTVLDQLKTTNQTPENATDYRNIKGQALFVRAKLFHQLAQAFAQTYDPATSSSALGIPLRTTSDFNVPSVRSTVEETYSQIVNDLKTAVPLLPLTGLHPVRPDRTSAYALLARVYLTMRKYEEAGKYADSSLALKSDLIDYNTVKVTTTYSFTANNLEVLYNSKCTAPLTAINARVDLGLYNLYATDDLRKTLLFQSGTDGAYTYKGSYGGGIPYFTGLTTAEVILIKAECQARQGLTQEALKTLGILLVKRFKTGKYVTPTASTAAQALSLVLTERRKELAYRCIRWGDIKRLNAEGAGITLTRTVLGQTYTLAPGDQRFALPIPEDIISLTGMPQNP